MTRILRLPYVGDCSGLAALIVLACYSSCSISFAEDLNQPPFAASLMSIETLPSLRPVAKVGSFSSYDRTGGNDDGFTGKYSFLRKEGDGLVIAELFGAGAITRIYTPSMVDAPIEFYFDGEDAPRLSMPLGKLFTGDRRPFVSPLVGHGAGGYYSYVPLEFSKSIKVVIRAKTFLFYQINYALYESDVAVRTFVPDDQFALPSRLANGARLSGERVLSAGETVTLWETRKSGRIQSFRLAPAEVFAGKERDIVLRIFWDGAQRPAVEVPVGDFFGYSFGRPASQSLLFGTDQNMNYSHFPMPFSKAARIELVSDRYFGEPLRVRWELVVSEHGKTKKEGYFHAQWHRENPTTDGRPFTYLDVAGRGHLVATILQSQGLEPGHTWFFEGDDEVMIDGKVMIHGTGSEDSFNGGWYDVPGRWDGRVSLPLSGCLEYEKSISRTGGYRVYLADAYSFRRSLRHTIEHGGANNNSPGDYVGTTFFYLEQREGQSALPASDDRAVSAPKGFSLGFYPSPPPIAALWRVSLNVTRAAEGSHGFASFDVDMEEPSAPNQMGGRNPNRFEGLFDRLPTIVLSVNVASSGKYTIFVDGVAGPDAAMIQLRVNDEEVGNAVDFYQMKSGRRGPQKLAEIFLAEGRNLLYLTVPGRNEDSTGARVDLIRVWGDRLP